MCQDSLGSKTLVKLRSIVGPVLVCLPNVSGRDDVYYEFQGSVQDTRSED